MTEAKNSKSPSVFIPEKEKGSKQAGKTTLAPLSMPQLESPHIIHVPMSKGEIQEGESARIEQYGGSDVGEQPSKTPKEPGK